MIKKFKNCRSLIPLVMTRVCNLATDKLIITGLTNHLNIFIGSIVIRMLANFLGTETFRRYYLKEKTQII